MTLGPDDYMPFDKYVTEQLGITNFVRQAFPEEEPIIDAAIMRSNTGVKCIRVSMLVKGVRSRQVVGAEPAVVGMVAGHPSSQLGLFLECGFQPWWFAVGENDMPFMYEGSFPDPVEAEGN